MAVAFDAATNTAFDTTDTKTTSHTATGSDRVAILIFRSASTAAPTSVTYGGTAMTSLGSKTDAAGNNVEILYLLSPATGAQTVSCTGGTTGWTFTCCTYTGGNAVNNFLGASGGVGTSSTVTITSATDNIVVGGVMLETVADANIAAGAGQTLRSAASNRHASSDEAGEASTVHSYSWVASLLWTTAGCNIAAGIQVTASNNWLLMGV